MTVSTADEKGKPQDVSRTAQQEATRPEAAPQQTQPRTPQREATRPEAASRVQTIPRAQAAPQAQAQAAPRARFAVVHPYLCLMGLFMGGFTGMYSETALNIALPQLSAAFGVDLALTQWLVVGYMLVIGLVIPFTSMLMKWFSARQLTLFALGVFLVGALISGFANSFGVALAGRAVQGIGTGIVLPLMFATIMEIIPPHKIGSAMGIAALIIMSAPAVGPTLAGFLIGAFSWRWIFFSFAIILAVGIVFEVARGVSPFQISKPHIDGASVVLSCIGFGGVVFGAGVSSLYGWVSWQVLGSIAVGVVALVLYVRRQLKMSVPVIDVHVFEHQGFRTGAVCMMVNFGITLSAMFVLPQFYQNAMGMDVTVAGLIMLPGGIINAVASMLSGKVYDRIGARIPAIAGFAISIAAAVLLLMASPESPLWYVIACHILLMVGVPLAMSPSQTHALASLPHELSTDGSTVLNTMQQVLGAVCTAVATSLLAIGQAAYLAGGGSSTAEAFASGAHMGFGFTIVLAAVGLLVALRIRKRAK